ncbi:MAG: plasmid mobilization relaxosome protein MobC [Coleofasciculaceae cyanobacterium]
MTKLTQEKRTQRILIRITPNEHQRLKVMAQQEGMSIANLIRTKTIYQRPPRRTTDVARMTYLELGKIGTNLNQIAFALNTANKLGRLPSVSTIESLQEYLTALEANLRQIRRDLVELDLIAALEDMQETGE